MTISVCTRLIAITACVLMLAGCGTSTAARYYTLDTATPVGTAANAASGSGVVVGPFRFAEYLQRAQIVTRGGGTRLDIAEFDRWASPLPAMFQRTLTTNLGIDLQSSRVVEFPTTVTAEDSFQVSGRVSRFDTDAAGRATLVVQWSIRDSDGSVLRAPARSTYRSNSAGADYVARVRAQSETVAAFSREIAAAIRELQSPPGG